MLFGTLRRWVKAAPANKTNYTLVWYTLYDLRPGNRAGPILTAPQPTAGGEAKGKREKVREEGKNKR